MIRCTAGIIANRIAATAEEMINFVRNGWSLIRHGLNPGQAGTQSLRSVGNHLAKQNSGLAASPAE